MRHKRFIFFIPIVLLALLISVPLALAKGPPNTFWKLVGNAGTEATVNFLGTTDGENLAIQPDPGNVGIGTDSPTEKLDVDGRLRVRTFGLTFGEDSVCRSPIGVLSPCGGGVSDARLKTNIEPLMARDCRPSIP